LGYFESYWFIRKKQVNYCPTLFYGHVYCHILDFFVGVCAGDIWRARGIQIRRDSIHQSCQYCNRPHVSCYYTANPKDIFSNVNFEI
jgi:hypothetical protein